MPIVSGGGGGLPPSLTVDSHGNLLVSPHDGGGPGVTVRAPGDTGFTPLEMQTQDDTTIATALAYGLGSGLLIRPANPSTDASSVSVLRCDTFEGDHAIMTVGSPTASGAVTLAPPADQVMIQIFPTGVSQTHDYLDCWNVAEDTILAKITAAGVGVFSWIHDQTITSGALPTVTCTSGVGRQVSTTRDVETVTPVTFNPGAATTATCTVAISPDNTTYSTLGVETEPAGVAFDGTIRLLKVRVPATWYIKLTVVNATLGTTTYY